MDKIVRQLKRQQGKEWLKIANEILTLAWKNTDKDIRITVEVDEETRRVRQNRLLFLWHNELSKHIEHSTGQIFDVDDIHEYVAEKLLPKRVITVDDEPIIARTQTRKLSVKDFADFITRYEYWAHEKYECKFSHPDDLYLQAVMRDEK